MIYLDNNATTAPDPRVGEAMLPFFGHEFGNPSSPHAAGRVARGALEKARAQVAAFLGAAEDAVVFTSGGTESINTALRGALAAQPGKRHIVTSAIEHSATKNLCQQLAREGCEVTWLPVDSGGCIDFAAYLQALRPDTAIVTMVWANNETGVLLPIGEMACVADERRIVFHADAVQAAGKVDIDLGRVPVHLLSVSAHKLHGPKGVGALGASGSRSPADSAGGRAGGWSPRGHRKRAGHCRLGRGRGFGQRCLAGGNAACRRLSRHIRERRTDPLSGRSFSWQSSAPSAQHDELRLARPRGAGTSRRPRPARGGLFHRLGLYQRGG